MPLLREAVDAAVLAVGNDDTYWFVHPLLAEVLERGLLPEERATLHAAFAAALDSAVSVDEMGVERVVDLADHHFRAGHYQEAYHWALLGAEAAVRAGGATEMVRLLRRALDLWPRGARRRPDSDRPAGPHPAAAERAGEEEEELAAVDDLLALIGPRAPTPAHRRAVGPPAPPAGADPTRAQPWRRPLGGRPARGAVPGQRGVRAGDGRARGGRGVGRSAVRPGAGGRGGPPCACLRVGQGARVCARGEGDGPGLGG